jgi:hypothetical protein
MTDATRRLQKAVFFVGDFAGFVISCGEVPHPVKSRTNRTSFPASKSNEHQSRDRGSPESHHCDEGPMLKMGDKNYGWQNVSNLSFFSTSSMPTF